MTNYNFSTLNDKEFEQIVRDLLNAKFDLGLQDFKTGPDGGVDLRFSTVDNNNSVVVQAKHYQGSGYTQLKRTLLKEELKKVIYLKPDRYIVATSLPLTAAQKDELKNGLAPFVLTSNDIISQQDLNAFLGLNKDIEQRYFKLWFSSLNIYNAVINNAIEGRTRYLLEKINEKIPFYVITKKFDQANEVLMQQKLLLISGQPGIGKTTLAEILLFEKAKNGFKIYKVENIKEAEEMVSPNNDERQVFYFDDFLGSNYLEIVNAHKTETQLTSFVERIRNTPNKYIILTTRTVILNRAIISFEKIGRSNWDKQQFEIVLSSYTSYEKALILYNHLYFRKIKQELHNVILKDKFYNEIINHKNYTPRIIEFITEKSIINEFKDDSYIQFIRNNLNNPKEIWRYSFNNQIEYLDRCFLLTLFSFENNPTEAQLLLAFEQRMKYEKEEHNQIISADQFNQSVKTLLSGFIIRYTFENQPKLIEFRFINPSLGDFLMGYITESYQERKSIVSSFVFAHQLKRFNPDKSTLPLEKELQLIIRDNIVNGKIKILNNEFAPYSNNRTHAEVCEILCRYCKQVNIDSYLLNELKQISFNNWNDISERMEYVLLNINDSPQTFDYIKTNFQTLIGTYIDSVSDLSSAENLPDIFSKFDYKYNNYIIEESGKKRILELIKSLLTCLEEDFKSDRKSDIMDFSEVNSFYDELYSIEKDLIQNLLLDTNNDYNFGIEIDSLFWEGKINENIDESEMYSASRYEQDRYSNLETNTSVSNESIIDDLFSKEV